MEVKYFFTLIFDFLKYIFTTVRKFYISFSFFSAIQQNAVYYYLLFERFHMSILYTETALKIAFRQICVLAADWDWPLTATSEQGVRRHRKGL